jgi:uncharacterized protein (TIGR00369 family)
MDPRSRVITWDDPKASALKGRSLSGIEFLQAMFDGEIPPPPILKLFGVRSGTVAPGLVTMDLPIGEYLYNPIGSVHGGAAATLLDTVMGCAVHSLLKQGQSYATLEIKISYLRPITDALDHVIAEGRIVNAGRRAAFAEGKIIDASGKLYATGSTTCAIW